MLYVRSLRWKNVILKKKKKKNRGIGGVGKGDNVHVTGRVVFFISLFYGVSWRYRFFGEVFQIGQCETALREGKFQIY